MKLTAAFKATWHTYRRQFPQLMLTMFLQLVLRLIVFTPLLFLAAAETRLLALLSIPLYMLIVPPARQNMAQCMQHALEGGNVFSLELVSFEKYGCKVWRGVKQALLLMLWGILFIGSTGLAIFVFTADTIEGVTDVFTLLKTLMNLGGGSALKGATVVMYIYAATLIPLFVGVAFHSGTRHAIALGGRKVLRGHRLGVIGCWLCGLVVLAPFAAVAAFIGSGYVSALTSAMASLSLKNISLPPVKDNLLALAAAAVLLLVPAVPFKQLLSAAYVRELKK
jgi:hypothetical protein